MEGKKSKKSENSKQEQTLLLNESHIEVVKDFCENNDEMDEQSVLKILASKLKSCQVAEKGRPSKKSKRSSSSSKKKQKIINKMVFQEDNI